MPGLTKPLDGLLRRMQAGGEPIARAKLARGLHISMRVMSETDYGLQLARSDNFPSMQEWKTVLKSMPVGCEALAAPKQLKHERMFYLKGEVRLAQQPWLDELID